MIVSRSRFSSSPRRGLCPSKVFGHAWVHSHVPRKEFPFTKLSSLFFSTFTFLPLPSCVWSALIKSPLRWPLPPPFLFFFRAFFPPHPHPTPHSLKPRFVNPHKTSRYPSPPPPPNMFLPFWERVFPSLSVLRFNRILSLWPTIQSPFASSFLDSRLSAQVSCFSWRPRVNR